MNGFEAALVVVAVIVFVIVSQLKGMTLSVKRTVVLPMVLSGYGLVDLSGLPHVRPVDVACIGASAVLAAAVGAFQGAAMHLEERDGALWGRMPLRGLWLWGALVLSRALVTVLALSLGAKAASSVGSVILVLGVNRMAQAAVVSRPGPSPPACPFLPGATPGRPGPGPAAARSRRLGLAMLPSLRRASGATGAPRRRRLRPAPPSPMDRPSRAPGGATSPGA